ncbi:arginyl-tRNA synthetase [Clostridium botulinum]|uniref:Arginine--tRNA ligase n=1 Tax=Clostridium botulinum TaxID=1491 RepID=A0A9Q1UZ18_CLOBO|nr:arginine--tRNA ligase [Clostridium botulinum]AEB75458.1 arginyl-tRNA synthetase [Clostridium botulinum BKT015925]KEI02870.1 arginyl-tRNA synthetase [Clostridium botulinum C/D str. Sp77]KOA78385.1 arginyl-tRNA synthetase [Clostridium botulinum]KOA83472.1 arginyl-tRNA synthetase [Clostridium botulinum]KOA87311.1 arginyl-tRNA synthetase [Clostridium botulinum]
MDYKKIIAERIKENVELDLNTIEGLIEIPPKSDMGDYAFPCFQLAKTFRKAPNMIAEELSSKINNEGFEKVVALGPYLNFFMDKGSFVADTLNKVLSEGERYGSSEEGKGKNVTIDYSSPNIAKPFHVGHLFSTSIGNSLYRMLNFEGYNSIGINHLGDWGTQFGKLISAYKRWVDQDALEKDPIKELLRIYVKFHDEAEKDPSLEDEGRMYFKKLEDGEKEEVELWERFKNLSLKEFKKVYELLGVKFDSYAGESFYNDKMDSVIKEIDKKGILVESNGAKVVMMDDENMPPCIIVKGDGATIYATRDLAAAFYRKKNYDFYKSIYVVGSDQSLHFKQVFNTIEKMGYDWANDCKHVAFGLVRFADKKLSTRKGQVIFLEDLLNESVSKTLEVINEKNPQLKNKEEVAKKVGIGAVIFTYLKNKREKDIVFNWNEMLNFEGETGPYVQYTYARGKSILRRAGEVQGEVNFAALNSQEEFNLVKVLGNLKEEVLGAIDKLEPSILTRYIIDVAKAFNKFYNAHNIMATEDIAVKNARLKLVEATCQVIKNGLDLLGIEVVEEM